MRQLLWTMQPVTILIWRLCWSAKSWRTDYREDICLLGMCKLQCKLTACTSGYTKLVHTCALPSGLTDQNLKRRCRSCCPGFWGQGFGSTVLLRRVGKELQILLSSPSM